MRTVTPRDLPFGPLTLQTQIQVERTRNRYQAHVSQAQFVCLSVSTWASEREAQETERLQIQMTVPVVKRLEK